MFSLSILSPEFANWTSVLLALLVVCVSVFYWSKMPPGPIGIPYFGYYPFLTPNGLHKQLAQMTKKYGDVFCFTVTGQTYVHLGSWNSMREALVTKADCFTKKTENFNLLMDSVGDGGLFYEKGEAWKYLRRFFTQKLKDYGMGKKTQETWLSECLQKTMDTLKMSNGNDIDALKLFTDTCTVSIGLLLFGNSDKIKDHDAVQLTEDFKTIIVVVTGNGTRLLLAGSFFKYIMRPFIPDMVPYEKAKENMKRILGNIFREHKKDFDKDNIRNLVDSFIDERRKLEEKEDPRYKYFAEKSFVNSLIQIFGDGSMSIGMLCAMILKELASRPEVQKGIQAEIDEVIGRDRFPSLDERSLMPYTNAVIYEIIRLSDFIPLFPSLECTEETTVCGCRVPKGSVLIANFYGALMDPRVYPQPEKFDHTRFLPDENKKIKSDIPNVFGMGRRSCIGESLVNMESFLFVITVLQNFDLIPASSQPEITSKEYKIMIKAVPRKL